MTSRDRIEPVRHGAREQPRLLFRNALLHEEATFCSCGRPKPHFLSRYFSTGNSNFWSDFQNSKIKDGGPGLKCYLGCSLIDFRETRHEPVFFRRETRTVGPISKILKSTMTAVA